jgi:hypothetical protein
VLVEAFIAEPAVERLDECVVGGLAGPGEVKDHPAPVSPVVHVARDELAALIDADRLGTARCAAHPVKRRQDIFAALAVANETEPLQIHLFNEEINNANEAVITDPVVQAFRKSTDWPRSTLSMNPAMTASA